MNLVSWLGFSPSSITINVNAVNINLSELFLRKPKMEQQHDKKPCTPVRNSPTDDYGSVFTPRSALGKFKNNVFVMLTTWVYVHTGQPEQYARPWRESNQRAIFKTLPQSFAKWALPVSIPKVVGSIPAVVRHIFQFARCGYKLEQHVPQMSISFKFTSHKS